MTRKEKRILKEAVGILVRKTVDYLKALPQILWRDRKYVAIKLVGLGMGAWSLWELLYGMSLTADDRGVYSASIFLGAIMAFAPAELFNNDDTPHRRHRKEEREEEEDVL